MKEKKEVKLDGMGVTELKAIAYDIIGEMEINRANLKMVNDYITKAVEAEKPKDKPK